MAEPRRLLPGVIRDVAAAGFPFALVGALAVAVRAEELTTKDIDLAVAVPDEAAARFVLRHLIKRRYRPGVAFNDLSSGVGLRGASIFPPGPEGASIPIDLLFNTCGAERDIVQRAESVEILPGLTTPVAQRGDLIAMKVLSLDDARRPKDRVHLAMLLSAASSEDLSLAMETLRLMEKRGFGFPLGKDDLLSELEQARALYSPTLSAVHAHSKKAT